MKFEWDGLEKNKMRVRPQFVYPASGQASDMKHPHPVRSRFRLFGGHLGAVWGSFCRSVDHYWRQQTEKDIQRANGLRFEAWITILRVWTKLFSKSCGLAVWTKLFSKKHLIDAAQFGRLDQMLR